MATAKKATAPRRDSSAVTATAPSEAIVPPGGQPQATGDTPTVVTGTAITRTDGAPSADQLETVQFTSPWGSTITVAKAEEAHFKDLGYKK